MTETLGTYEDLAQEYYDESRHPTCANFRQASAILFRKWLPKLPSHSRWSCEIGPGKSLVAEFRTLGEFSSEGLFLIDSSHSMLKHSRIYSTPRQIAIIGTATTVPLAGDSVEVAASFLGDPYNVSQFWHEVFRILKVGGKFMFTTPSYEWASAFRKGLSAEKQASAEFVLANGRKVFVPSFILPDKKQFDLIKTAKFKILDFAGVRVSDLDDHRVSPKLMVKRSEELTAVTGYLCEKSSGAGS